MKSDLTLKSVQNILQNEEENDARSVCSYMSNENNYNLNRRQPKINVTLAPNVSNLNESNLPHNPVKKNPNVVVANPKSLNSSEHDADKENGDEQSKKEIYNELERYRELLEKKRKLIELKEGKARNESECERELEDFLDKYEREFKQKMAMKKIGSDDMPQSRPLSSLNDEFKSALSQLERQLLDFEQKSGHSIKTKHQQLGNKSGLSSTSLTLNLIGLVSQIMEHLRETTLDLNREKQKQEELNKQLDIHRKLIDGLTTEMLSLREQNEKIMSEYINQQAKLEAELDQMKIMLRSSEHCPPPHITQQRPSAFSSQSLVKPIAQQQQHQQHQLNSRPLSSLSSVNLNDLSKLDRFPERLKAFLQSDSYIEHSSHLAKSNSMDQFQPHRAKPTDTLSLNEFMTSFDANSMLADKSQGIQAINNVVVNNEMQLINNFKEQINDLNTRNAKSQQLLKQLQSASVKHQQYLSQNSIVKKKLEMEDDKTAEELRRLKQQQEQLREQIKMLDKHKEKTQFESCALLVNSAALMGKSNGSLTPSLSPIQPENIFSHENELNKLMEMQDR